MSQFLDSEDIRAGPRSVHDPWDEVGSEASEHARIWHLYNEEAAKIDQALIDGCNRGIDGLLVFVSASHVYLSLY